MSAHISTLDLNRYRYNEMDASQRAQVDLHVGECKRCHRRLQVQQANREAFVLQPVPQVITEATASPQAPWWKRWIPATGLMLAAALALFVVLPLLNNPTVDVPSTRAKGDLPELELWVGSERGPKALRAGQSLHEGDKVQLLFRPAGAPWVTLAGADGTGQIEVWGHAEALGDHLQPAPFALTLDDAPGPQIFYVIAADHALSEEEALSAIEGTLENTKVLELTVPKE